MRIDQPSFGDLSLILIWLILTIVSIFLPPLNQSLLRILCALPTILFIPGYALIAALFPAKKDLEGLERVALSFGLSIAVVPLIGLVLNYTPWGIRLVPILLSLVSFVAVMTIIAAFRRIKLASDERFRVPFGALANAGREALLPTDSSRMDRIVSIVLIFSIILAIGATVYVIVVPKEGEHFTEFYILGKNGKAADYPREIVVGTENFVIIGIGNHEFRDVTYTVELHAMNMTFDPVTNSSLLNAMKELNRFEVLLSHNTTYEQPWTFSVAPSGFNRIQFLLFNETIPGQEVRGMDRINASYRDLHLWVEMTPSR